MMTDNKELGALRQRHAEAEAEVARLRSVEADFHQLSDVAGWHHGETQIALARAKQAEADLAALRRRHAEAVKLAYYEAFDDASEFYRSIDAIAGDVDAQWLRSSAKKELEGA